MGRETSFGELTRIGVVGLGTMGAGIAEVLARAGFDICGWRSSAAAA
ncbi:3-hydroxyacyl-CoA dehydrogenase NAD-binding domain-containing protein [Frankia sp. EAN1pec]